MVLGLLNSVPRLTAQTDQEAPTVRYPLPTLLDVQPGLEVERGPHHQVLQTVSRYQQPDGQVLLETNTITVLATGLFHEQDGRLVASSEDLEEVPGGIVGRRGPHQAIFPLELTDPAGVDVLSADKQRFRSRVIGLSYYDAGSGRSVLLAEPQASRAELLAPNRVIYRDAFDDVDADVVFEYRKGSVSQEVVLRGPLPGPEEFGLEGWSTRLEVLTEWLEAPEPVKERRVIPRAVDQIVRAGMAEPDPVDDRLEFGSYLMGPGRVFWVEGVEGGEEPGYLVAKRWDVIGERTVLFESVDYTAIAGWLDRLGGQASASPPGGGKSKSYAATARPKRAVSGRVLPPRSTARVEQPARAGKGRLVASASRPKGLVLDWTMLLTGSDVTLRARETYLVMDTVSLGGTTTVQGGAVVKFTNTPQAMIVCNGPVVCDTGPYRPAVFTAWRDDTIGQIIPTSNGNPFTNYYANPALQIMTSAQVLHDLRVSHAQKGIFFYDTSASPSNAL
jgi:hypothetical protein